MPRFAANLNYLWAELPYLDRFDAAAEAGFEAVEVSQPYDVPAPETLAALRRNDLRFVLLNAPGPNYAGGARGFAAVPGGQARFDYDMRRAVRYAHVLGANLIHIQCGDASGPDAHETLVENLKRASQSLPEGLALTIEPMNAGDKPDGFLRSYTQAEDILDAVGATNVGLQFDSYHAHLITGDAVRCFEDHANRICHIQIGDAPDRSPPGTGEIDFPALFAAIDARGYAGWVSAEYLTDDRTEAGLGWRP